MTAWREHDVAILRSVDDSRLVSALEANTAEAYADVARNPRADVYSGPDMVRFISGVPAHMFNGVAQARLPAHRLDAALDETLRPFSASSTPMYWWVGPSTRPVGLGARLVDRGLKRAGDIPGMAIDISALRPAREAISMLNIAPVTSESELAEWTRTVVSAYGMPANIGPALLGVAMRHCLRADSRWVYYRGRLDGEPVAAAAMFAHAGVASVHSVATIPEARRRGIGGAITRVALRQAGDKGYHVGVARSSALSFPVYHSLGFRTYMTFGLYSWSPPQRPAPARS